MEDDPLSRKEKNFISLEKQRFLYLVSGSMKIVEDKVNAHE